MNSRIDLLPDRTSRRAVVESPRAIFTRPLCGRFPVNLTELAGRPGVGLRFGRLWRAPALPTKYAHGFVFRSVLRRVYGLIRFGSGRRSPFGTP
jgi:hypothetical protein